MTQFTQSQHIRSSPIQSLETDWTNAAGIRLFIKREDLLHPLYGGNKIRKLKYVVAAAKNSGKPGLLTCGGAYSNHVLATAVYGNENGLKTAAIIRGESIDNLTLDVARKFGMDLIFVSRAEYQKIRAFPSHVWTTTRLPEKDWFFIPEGGHHPLAMAGVGELVSEIAMPYDYLATPCGTGTTFAGLLQATRGTNTKLLGFPILKNGEFIIDAVKTLLGQDFQADQIDFFSSRFCFGGYAKMTHALKSFIFELEHHSGILFDPVYNGKMLFGLRQLCLDGHFPAGACVVAIHTGGQQGWHGFKEPGTLSREWT